MDDASTKITFRSIGELAREALILHLRQHLTPTAEEFFRRGDTNWEEEA